MQRTRRGAVRTAGLAAAVALTGCVDRFVPGGGGSGPEYELFQLGSTSTIPEWNRGDGPPGTVELYRSRESAEARIDAGIAGLDEERREPAREFVAATDFERSVLLFVASAGPDTCHDEVEVRRLRYADGTLTGTVAAKDTAAPGVGCGDAITYPSALVRVTPEGLPDRVEVTVVTGWDSTSTVTATASE